MSPDPSASKPPSWPAVRVHTVIVHHRGLEMLDACLRSLLDSTDVELEIVIVSNGCDEALPEIVEGSERIHVTTPPEPVGFSEANNLGAAWAEEHLGTPDAYYFVNNDTESRPETLARLLRALRKEVAAIAGPLTLIHAAPDHINSVGIRITEDAGAWDDGIGQTLESYGPLHGTKEVAAVTGSALLIDAGAFQQLGGWSEVYEWYYEDIDLCLRAWKRGFRVIHVSGAVILHRISATMSEGSERKLFYFRRNRLLIGLLHWPPDALRRLLWRATYHEILRAPWRHSEMQRRALGDIAKHLPRYWSLRRQLRGDDRWQRFLEPIGSVPEITLPELTTTEPVETTAEEELPIPESTWDSAREFCIPVGEERPRRRFLVLGWGPLPVEEARMHFAPGGRTWQLAKALAGDGHAVCIAYARMPGSQDDAQGDSKADASDDAQDKKAPGEKKEPIGEHLEGELLVYSLERRLFDSNPVLEGLIEAFKPDALVAASAVPAQRAVAVAGELPVWADLFGDPIAEAQAKSMSQGGDHLSAYLRLMNEVLARADAFSAVSERQKWALIGQLGLAGRLNSAVGGHMLVHMMPCAALVTEIAQELTNPDQTSPKRALNEDLPVPLDETAILALWSGSFNTWCDVETLFAGLERAMAEEPRLIFVATGGAVAGHDETTYARLVELIEGSEVPERWHLVGSLPRPDFAKLRSRADFGIVTEIALYERLLGSSGRVLDWLSHGRPVICTGLSEVGQMVAHGGFGLAYHPGDAEDLARCVLSLARLPAAERQAMGQAGEHHARTHLSIHATTAPLRSWALAPDRAPDAELPTPNYLLAAGREAVREELQAALDAAELERRAAEERHHATRAELGDIHQSKMWQLWMLTYRVRRWLRLG